MSTPFFMRLNKTIEQAERAAKQVKLQQDVIKAQRDVKPRKKSVFSQAIKMAAGVIPDEVEDVAADVGKGAWKGIQKWNNQIQSVPASLFTEGTVEDGQYTTKRNLIGNPLSNIASHVKAQREVGMLPNEKQGLLGGLKYGLKGAQQAGQAFEEDPDISQGLKFGTSVAFDPASYVGAGLVSKVPKIAAIGGAKGKLARGGLSVLEGFENPAQVGKFAVGGAIGTELASKYDVPGIPEVVEQLAGGLGGGIGGAAFKTRHLKEVDPALAKLQGREGKHAALGMSTEVVEAGERVKHGTTTYIPEGEILISPKGDMTAGFYFSRDGALASRLAEEGGDTANVTGFPEEFIKNRKERLAKEGGNQVFQYKPRRDMFFLNWDEYLTQDEASRINNVLASRGLERVVTTNMTPAQAVGVIKPSREGFGGQTPNILGVFKEAGFDGFSQDKGGYPQFVLFDPNGLLDADLSPATVVKGSALNKSTTSSQLGKPKMEVEIKKNVDGKWEFEHPDGQISEGFSFNEMKNWAESYGYNPVYKGPISELDNAPNDTLSISTKSGFNEGFPDTPTKSWNQAHLEIGLSPNKLGFEYGPGDYYTYTDPSTGVMHKGSTVPELVGKLDDAGVPYVDVMKQALLDNESVKAQTLAQPSVTKAVQKEDTYFQANIKEAVEAASNPESQFAEKANQLVEWYEANLITKAEFNKDWEKIVDEGYGPNIGKAVQPKQGNMLSTQQLSLKTKLTNMYPHIPSDVAHKYVKKNYDTQGYALNEVVEDFQSFAFSEIGPAVGPKVAPAIKPNKATWKIAGKTVDSKANLKYSSLSSKQKDLVHQISGLHPDDDLSNIIDQVVKNTETDGTWKSYKKIQPTPVDPDEIAGITKPTGPQTVDEFIDYTEKQLGKPYEHKDYTAPGQEGSPIAGKPKGKGEVTPAKFGDKWSAAGFVDEDLGDLMDTLTKAGYKVNDPFGGVGGGALPEILITPITPEIGLTKGEKISNAIAKVKRFVIDHGVENNEIATPLANEYLRINRTVKVHATNLGKLAQRVEKLAGIRHPEDIIDMDAISDEARRAVTALQRSEEAFYELQLQMGVKKPLNPTDFWDELKLEEYAKDKSYSDMLNEYGNAVANKVSDEWMKQQINRLGETIKLSDEAGKKIPTSTVSGINTDVKLPKNVGDVLSKAVSKVHPKHDSEWAQLFNAINNQLRGIWAAGDASFNGIQMIPTWADNPVAAMKATKIGFHTLKEPTVMAEFILKHDELRYGTGKPTVTEYIAHNMFIAQALGQGTDVGGIGGKIQRFPVYGKFLEKSNTLFTETGNANRIMIGDYLWDQYEAGGIAMLAGIPLKGGVKVGAKEGMTRAQILDAIGEAANRATGYSHRGFGGPYGAALFFAPRFMQSQFEMVMKASWGNQLENQVARRQLAKLMALGAGLTIAMNEFRGEETEFDPRDSNFMRIRNVGGTDVSIFGPWDTLVKGIIRSAPSIGEDGDITLGNPGYLFRSKLSPVLSMSLDWGYGENVIGEPSRNWVSMLKNTFLPFSLREIGGEPLAGSAVGFFGGKAAPLTESEKLDNKLKTLGIKKDDPEYLIKRREYLSEHPEDVPKASTDEFKRSQEVQTEIKARRKANDDLALSSGQTLVKFRENRKTLLTEQRNRLNEVIKSDTKKVDSKQRGWLNSYFELFDDEDNKDFITGEINPDNFDAAVAKWVNTSGNGTEALNFVNRFMGTGLNTVESTYYNDIRKLDAAGYFDKPRYQNMKSDLTEDEIDSLVRVVDSFRVANPDIQEMAWAVTARRLLKDSISNEELLDVIHSRLKAYQNPEITELKKQYAKETLWFNPRADWNSYTNYTPGNKTAGSSGGKLTKPKLGGMLKASLNKPSLK